MRAAYRRKQRAEHEGGEPDRLTLTLAPLAPAGLAPVKNILSSVLEWFLLATSTS